MEAFENLKSVKNVVFVLTVVCFCLVHCSPNRAVSYREGVDQEQLTTSKLNRDRSKKERFKIIASNSNFEIRSKDDEDVKSVLPGENTMWQSGDDDDDDDDDDGGEYEGVDYNSRQDVLEPKRKNEEMQMQCKPPESVPMMLIRQVDMVAMKIPVEEAKNIKNSKELQGFKGVDSFNVSKNVNGPEDSKNCKLKTGSRRQKEWSRWSPCSRPCGKGVQSRWRIKPGPGLQDRERQLRPCNLGDCSNSKDFQLHQSYP